MTKKWEEISVTPHWKKNKDEIWAERFAPMFRPKVRHFNFKIWSFAASILLVLCVSYFYEIEVNVQRGLQEQVELPDHSSVAINSESSIRYKPIWWYIDRQVKLKGEAYFEVTHGKHFAVVSSQGIVEVLGTKFNVYSRPNGYKVTCLTGRVSVKAKQQEAILSPGMQTEWKDSTLTTKLLKDVTASIVWTHQAFSFHQIPLPQVLKEIERRYAIKIKVKGNIQHYYSGQFKATDNPQEILDVIGETFNISLIALKE